MTRKHKPLLNHTQYSRLAKYPADSGFIAVSHGGGVVQVLDFHIGPNGEMLGDDDKPLVYRYHEDGRSASYVVARQEEPTLGDSNTGQMELLDQAQTPQNKANGLDI